MRSLSKIEDRGRPDLRPAVVVAASGRRATVAIRWPHGPVDNPFIEEFPSVRRALVSARRTGKILDYLVLIVCEGGRR
jgi:hypothetical protein